MNEDYKLLGLNLILDFITEEEEKEIISNFSGVSFEKKKNTQGRNSIKRYGSKKPYNSNIASLQIPEFLEKLGQKLVDNSILAKRPNSISINEYCKGQKIDAHTDSKDSGPVISILSLLSDATMVFDHKKESFKINLPKRSLIQMKEEIRWKWRHSILPVVDNRYSIVFRDSDNV
jgi:alkylated DNA repair dioxygenase AlkB